MGCNDHTGKEMKGIMAKDRSKLLAFLPHSVFEIAEDYDARLHAKGTEILILFNGKDTYSGNCLRRTLFTEGSIFAQPNLFMSVSC